jgi:hypothetical protein
MCRRSFSITLVVALMAVLGLQQRSQAQYRGGLYPGGANPYNPKPTVSPYLNLLQGGGGALNLPQYQTLVRPFLEQQAINDRNAFDSQLLRRQVNSLQNQTNRSAMAGGRPTGHPTRYMNYSHYYYCSVRRTRR